MSENTKTQLSAAERVANGIAWLDAQAAAGTGIPANWRELVDATKLRMGSFEHCVLGQIGGHVTDGERHWSWYRETYADELGMNYGSFESASGSASWGDVLTLETSRGFNLDYSFFDRSIAWNELTQAWVDALVGGNGVKE